MLVIVASRRDPEARALVSRWDAHRAALLTCEDLSLPGWRHSLHPEGEELAVIGGRITPVGEIDGVLVRWPAVFDRELLHIEESDREYVAAEMTAFLRSWLVSLRCPVVNPPSAGSLVGPAWRPEQWVWEAAALGVPVRPVRRRVERFSQAQEERSAIEHHTVTVVGGRWFGAVDPLLAGHARRLAAAAGVELLAAHFTHPGKRGRLIAADLIPDLGNGEIADAVAELLLAERDNALPGTAA